MTQARLDLGPAEAPALSRWAPAEWPVAADWQKLLAGFWRSAPAEQLACHLQDRLAAGARIYPAAPLHALALTPLAEVRVLILGQDPYHGPGQAHGLAFSVQPGTKPPPSLRNIFKELARDPLIRRKPDLLDGSLMRWAYQGVLLLNTCLTVEDGQPGAHAKIGWEVLTDKIIIALSKKVKPMVFMLWGAQAQKKAVLIEQSSCSNHLVLQANHPSPLSAMRGPSPFLGCGHFSLANAFLREHQTQAINW